ncbi:MAG: hypothetical protein RQ741_02270 [Wenzhouxiangellaceae bacterium]|nr:hypothetical protein [Wenzhouxiangellaceae bacterium]
MISDTSRLYPNVDIDLGSFSETETGFNVRASADLAGGLYLQGAWDHWEIGRFDVDTDLYKIGLGYRFDLDTNTDLFFEGSYAAIEVGSADEDGFRGDVGLRHGFNESFEGRIFGGLQTDGSDTDGIVGADLLYKFQRNFGVSVGVESFEFDLNIFRANLRLSF